MEKDMISETTEVDSPRSQNSKSSFASKIRSMVSDGKNVMGGYDVASTRILFSEQKRPSSFSPASGSSKTTPATSSPMQSIDYSFPKFRNNIEIMTDKSISSEKESISPSLGKNPTPQSSLKLPTQQVNMAPLLSSSPRATDEPSHLPLCKTAFSSNDDGLGAADIEPFNSNLYLATNHLPVVTGNRLNLGQNHFQSPLKSPHPKMPVASSSSSATMIAKPSHAPFLKVAFADNDDELSIADDEHYNSNPNLVIDILPAVTGNRLHNSHNQDSVQENLDEVIRRIAKATDLFELGHFLDAISRVAEIKKSGAYRSIQAKPFPQLEKVKFLEADCLISLASYTEAESVINTLKMTVKKLSLLGDLAYNRGIYEDARRFYSQAWQKLDDEDDKSFDKSFDSSSITSSIIDDIDLQGMRVLVMLARIEISRCAYVDALSYLIRVRDIGNSFTTEKTGARLQVIADMMGTQAAAMQEKSQYGRAVKVHRQTLKTLQKIYGNTHPKLGAALNNFAMLNIAMCEFDDAESHIEEGLRVRKKYFGESHPEIASSLQTKARLLTCRGRFSEALSVMESAVTMQRKFFSKHPDLARMLFYSAEIKRLLGRPVEAQVDYQSSLAMRLECFHKETHIEVAESIFGIGMNAIALGNFHKAELSFIQSLSIRQKLRQDMGVETHLLVDVNNLYLGYCYTLMGRYGEAYPLVSESGKNICTIMGKNHCLVAESLHLLGELCLLRGKYADSKKLLTYALSLRKNRLGDSHPDVAHSMLAVAENARCTGEFEMALDISTEALNIMLHASGSKKSTWLAIGLAAQAKMLSYSGAFEDADKLYTKALHILKREIGETNTHYALILGDAGESFRFSQRFVLARSVLEKTLEQRMKEFHETHILVYETMLCIAMLEMDLGTLESYRIAIHSLNGIIIPGLEFLLQADREHPLILFAKANAALCLNAIISNHVETKNLEELSKILDESHPIIRMLKYNNKLRNEDIALPGQSVIDKVLEVLELSPQLTFTPSHPWIIRLGGPISGNNGGDHVTVSSLGSGSYYSQSSSSRYGSHFI